MNSIPPWVGIHTPLAVSRGGFESQLPSIIRVRMSWDWGPLPGCFCPVTLNQSFNSA